MLSRIVPDPSAFQGMMRRTRATISGSMALHYLLRFPNTRQPGDVDLIVPNHCYEEVVEFISSIHGANVINEYPQNYPVSGFSHIFQVQTPLVKFDIIQSSEASPFHPLAFYYDTRTKLPKVDGTEYRWPKVMSDKELPSRVGELRSYERGGKSSLDSTRSF